MDMQAALLEVMEKVQNELLVLFEENGLKRENLGPFGDVFYNEFDRYLTNGGKRVRPFLTLTTFDAVAGDSSKGNILRAALAIELLHNGSLLHDDVIDKDDTRRGLPSFHVIFRELYLQKKLMDKDKAQDFGEAMSIFAGDLCFPFAIESLIQSGFPSDVSLKALHAFSEGFKDVIDGVIIETGDTINPESSKEIYEKMIYLKTGALIRKAVEIGAILGGGSDSQITALVDYCNGIGKAFQIQDDILGIFGEPEELGKPVGGDIRENKQTILRIFAMDNSSKEQKERLSQLMGNENLSIKELEEVRTIFKETGSLENAIKMIHTATKEAINSLERAEPALKEKAKNKFINLALYLQNRTK